MSQRKRMLRHGPRTGVLAASIGALVASGGISTIALGQDNDEDEAASSADTIIVTGTRIRNNDFEAANATTVITAQDMQDLGVVSVADMVNQLPNNIATVSPEATADSPYFLGASIANLRGMNTAFGTRTLTLLDSRRMTPTNNGGSVDMNFIPSALVGRIETVTGGASATYGADAMAGVVNVIIDDNIDDIRVDLAYLTSDESDGDQYTFSFGTGAEFFEGRGRLTVGFDSSRQDAIEDCSTREACARGTGLLRNGSESPALLGEYDPRGGPIVVDGELTFGGATVVFDGLPEWVVQDGQRYSTTPEGVMSPFDREQWGYPCATMDAGTGTYDLSGCADPADYEIGWYRLNEAGNDLIPYFTPDEVTIEELAMVSQVGDQTGQTTSYQGDGNRWSTNKGLGRGIYDGVPIRPETSRDNLFLRFNYELEGGIRLGADLTYGQTESESLQNSARNNLQSFCMQPGNAYLQPGMAGELLRNVYNQRAVGGISTESWWTFASPAVFGEQVSSCRQAPYLGGSNAPRDDDIDAVRYDFAPGMPLAKDFSQQVDRRNLNKSDSMSLTLTANGNLFEGGSWTWDAYAQFGHTENRQTLSGWRAARRWDLAIDSTLEGWDSNGDGVPDFEPGDYAAAEAAGADPLVACSINSQYATFDDGGTEVGVGEFTEERWITYLQSALGDQVEAEANEDIDLPALQAELAQVLEQYRAGCTPFNPLGSGALTPEQIAYIFPTLYEGTDNDQTALSLSFSGDAWRGIGNAGPMRMAAGVDWRENDTFNLSDPNRYLGADFNFVGNSNPNQAVQRIYGDNWAGTTTTEEAWVEFDLPLLRDKPGADYLAFNASYRETHNQSDRISGTSSVGATSSKREVSSWKATMQWQPVDIMRVRMTRSADTRAPSSRELFGTQSYATESNGQLEITNPWRYELPNGAGFANQFISSDSDLIIQIDGGNAGLSPERSVTETIGVVFQPVESVPGLQVSVDYYQTTIEAGVREMNVQRTISACNNEIGLDRFADEFEIPEENWSFCPNITFADPGVVEIDQEVYVGGAQDAQGNDLIDPATDMPVADGTPNNWARFADIISVAESTINEEDYVSRGIDYSLSYSTQLSGGGQLTGRALLTRYLEQTVVLENTFGVVNVAGQTGSSNLASYAGSFGSNFSPTPRIRGNLFMTYRKNAFSVTAQARYTGTGKLNIQNGWLAPGETTVYLPYSNGQPIDGSPLIEQSYDPDLERTILDNDLPSWTTLSMNFNYDFGLSRMQLDRFETLNAYLNIDNIGDRIPTFFSGTGAGGVNSSYFSAMGRTYRMGVRMSF